MNEAFIVDAVRTPRAKRKGKFSSIHPADLLTYPLRALTERTKVPSEAVGDVLVGCVTQTGEQGWCVGRKSVLGAGWPFSVPATTINRLCGSGQQACNFAAQGVMSGQHDLVVGAGLEHMTRVPMFSDCTGEESALLTAHYPDLVPQGLAAEIMSSEFKLTRTQLDEFAAQSQHRAAAALSSGAFKKSVIAVPYKNESGADQVASEDDNVRASTTVEGLAALKTVFKPDGVITAGNASAIVDGAAAMLLASPKGLKDYGLKPRARVVSMSAVGSPPRIMLTGPIEASRQALKRAGLNLNQIDLWEINEAFAPVPLVTARELDIDPNKINVNGGGIALGHPLGATGVMLLSMALDELEKRSQRYALITMCIGLGMGIATIIERV